MKLPVTKALDGSWMFYEESDIRKACKLAGCDDEDIEECIELMKNFECDCVSCYLELCNSLNVLPEYKFKEE